MAIDPERRKGLEARIAALNANICILDEMRDNEDCDSLDSMMRDDALEDAIRLMEKERATLSSEIFWGVPTERRGFN